MTYNFTLYMTTDCNFKCKYCYEDYKKHLYLDQETNAGLQALLPWYRMLPY